MIATGQVETREPSSESTAESQALWGNKFKSKAQRKQRRMAGTSVSYS